MNHSLGLVIESLVAILLVVTICYCALLNKRLKCAQQIGEIPIEALISRQPLRVGVFLYQESHVVAHLREPVIGNSARGGLLDRRSGRLGLRRLRLRVNVLGRTLWGLLALILGRALATALEQFLQVLHGHVIHLTLVQVVHCPSLLLLPAVRASRMQQSCSALVAMRASRAQRAYLQSSP